MSDHGCAETGMSIPTEAQIDYLTRAGVQAEYLWGDSWNAEEAKKYSWYFGNSGKTTHAVGQLLPNNWGFYDVVGNAAVWCPDCVCNYDADPNYDAETNTATDPVGGASGNFVLRGSSYITDQTGSKMTLWYRNSSWSRASSDSGFRLSLVLP